MTDISIIRDKLSHINFIARLSLAFLFIFHGLVPKIIWLSPIEISLVQAGGLGVSYTILSPIAGILEIILGLLIFFKKKSKVPIFIAAFSLCILLLYVAILMPPLLVEAFNPVTTNILGLSLCYLIIVTIDKSSTNTP